MSKITRAAKNAEKFITDNSPTVLTGIGVAGAIFTAVLAGRAGYQAGRVIAEVDRDDSGRRPDQIKFLTMQEKFKLTWKHYIPPVLSCGATVAVVIAANQVSSRRAAAMAAAYSLSEKAFSEYKEKVIEKVGGKTETDIRDSIAQDRVAAAPVGRHEVFVTGAGNVLCFESYTGRYFRSSMEAMRKAQNDVNHVVLNDYYASLSDFYDRLGLPRTAVSDELGWNSDKLLELNFSTTMGENDEPCIVVNFHVEPIRNYHRIH
jgi:hypothetical protein